MEHLGEYLSLIMFAVTLFAVMLGYPVAFTLAGVGLAFAGIGHLLGIFDFTLFSGIISRYFGTMVNEVLVSVPLFVFMGIMLERSKIAEQLLETMGQLFGPIRGGLGVSVILVGALLAASTGIVGATVTTMGLLSLPAMMRAGYDPKLASGIICASGTLGQIIPPSTVLIFLGDMLQAANSKAQLAKGNLSPEPVSVGDLFAGALIPGLVLVGLYLTWTLFRAFFWKDAAPALVMSDAQKRGLALKVLKVLVPPLALIIAVLGSIVGGFASPTESASVGAVGAILLAVVNRQFSLRVLQEVMLSTLKISSMVFIILLGASVFSLVFRGLGGEDVVTEVLHSMPGGVIGALIAVNVLMFLLGFFLDTFEIIFIVVPITAPALLAYDISPVWLGVLFGVNLQTSFLTPPFGFSLFYLRGVAPRSVTTGHIYRGIVPFVALQIVALFLLWVYPSMATWLPKVVYAEDNVITIQEPGDSNDGEVDSDQDDLFAPEEPVDGTEPEGEVIPENSDGIIQEENTQ